MWWVVIVRPLPFVMRLTYVWWWLACWSLIVVVRDSFFCSMCTSPSPPPLKFLQRMQNDIWGLSRLTVVFLLGFVCRWRHMQTTSNGRALLSPRRANFSSFIICLEFLAQEGPRMSSTLCYPRVNKSHNIWVPSCLICLCREFGYALHFVVRQNTCVLQNYIPTFREKRLVCFNFFF